MRYLEKDLDNNLLHNIRVEKKGKKRKDKFLQVFALTTDALFSYASCVACVHAQKKKNYKANDFKYHLDRANSRGFDWFNHLNL